MLKVQVNTICPRPVRILRAVTAVVTMAACHGSDKISGPSSPAVPKATTLLFVQQPTRTLVGHSIYPVVTVEAVDAQGNRVTTGSVTVRLAMRTPTGASAPLSGITEQVSVDGIATFTGLTTTVAGENMTLVANAIGLASATSESFKVDYPPIAIDSSVLHLVSDSTARASGLYVFQTSTSDVAGPDSGAIIVGAEQGGFLRRVIGVDRTGSSLRVQTVAVSLDEVMQEDSLVVHLTLDNSEAALQSRRGLIGPSPPSFVPSNAAITGTAGEYTVKNLTLYADASSGRGLIVSQATMSLHPTVDLRIVWGGLLRPTKAHIAFGGAMTFDALYDVGFSQATARGGSFLLGQILFPFTIAIPTPFGPVPISASFTVPITLEWNARATAKTAMELGWTSRANASVAADWTSTDGWKPSTLATLTFAPELPTTEVNGSLTARLGLRATPRLVVAGALGGDLWTEPYAEGVATADLEKNQWETSCHSAVQLGIDVDFRLFGLEIGAYNRSADLLDTIWPTCAHSGTIPTAPAPVESITVSPAAASVTVGNSQLFTASLKDAAGNTLTDRKVTWSINNENIATMNSATGLATGVAPGNATIAATSEGNQGTAKLSVSQTSVASVAVSPATATISVGGTQQFTATLLDAGGKTLTGRTVTWSTDNSGIATVNGTGIATAVASGSAKISATSEGRTGTATINVAQPPAPPTKYTIEVSASPEAGGSVTGGGVYSANGSVTVTATPARGYRFIRWTEGGRQVSTSATYTFSVTSNRTLIAVFETDAPVTVDVAVSASPPDGGTVTGGGTYSLHSTVTVSATPAVGYSFVRWTEGGNEVSTSSTYRFNASGNRALVAEFTTSPPASYSVVVSASPPEGGSVSGGGTYTAGSTVTVTATPSSGYSFARWTEGGNQVSTSASYQFAPQGNRNLVAEFTQNPVEMYTISVSASPAAGGSVSGGGKYSAGSPVTITASPSAGYSFSRWTENGSQVSSSASYQFTSTRNRTLVAVFDQDRPPTIEVSRSEVDFSPKYLGPLPPSQTVEITNGGGGTLTGLEIQKIILFGLPGIGGLGEGNLTASLNSSTAPSTLTISLTRTDMAPGPRAAIVPIISSARTGGKSVIVRVNTSVTPTKVPGTVKSDGKVCISSAYLGSAPVSGTGKWLVYYSTGGFGYNGGQVGLGGSGPRPGCEDGNSGATLPNAIPGLTAGTVVYLLIIDPFGEAFYATFSWDGTNATPT